MQFQPAGRSAGDIGAALQALKFKSIEDQMQFMYPEGSAGFDAAVELGLADFVTASKYEVDKVEADQNILSNIENVFNALGLKGDWKENLIRSTGQIFDAVWGLKEGNSEQAIKMAYGDIPPQERAVFWISAIPEGKKK
jgi:hypothetical protein